MKIPILMYHNHVPQFVKTTCEKYQKNSITNSVESFYQQLHYLHNEGFTTLTSNELANFVETGKCPYDKPIVITFDDGLLSVREFCYPLLKAYRFSAICFVITSRISASHQLLDYSKLQFMNQTQIVEVSDVIEIASHTHALHNIKNDGTSDMLCATKDELVADLLESLRHVNAKQHLALPFGHFNENTLNVCIELGIKYIYTTQGGCFDITQAGYTKLINRYNISSNLGLSDFAAMVNKIK